MKRIAGACFIVVGVALYVSVAAVLLDFAPVVRDRSLLKPLVIGTCFIFAGVNAFFADAPAAATALVKHETFA